MNIAEILSFIGALGLGSLIGIFIKSFFDRKLNDKKMLFEARIKAYSGITGRICNNFLEPDITKLHKVNEALVWAKFNQILSEANLLSSSKLSKMLDDYMVVLYDFHCALNIKDEKTEKDLHEKVVELGVKIVGEMRKELYIDK